MLIDDLEKRATERPAAPVLEIARAIEILGVGFVWSIPGMLFGLLAATVASTWSDNSWWFGLFGTLVGGVAGLFLESGAKDFDMPAS